MTFSLYSACALATQTLMVLKKFRKQSSGHLSIYLYLSLLCNHSHTTNSIGGLFLSGGWSRSEASFRPNLLLCLVDLRADGALVEDGSVVNARPLPCTCASIHYGIEEAIPWRRGPP